MTWNFSNMTITGISRIVSIKLKPDTSRQMYNRETEGLIVALSGIQHYIYNGVTNVLDPNHALLFSRGINYSFASKTESICIVINFTTTEPFPFTGIESVELDLRSMAIRMENSWSFKKKSYRMKCLEELYSFFIKINYDGEYTPSSYSKQIAPSIKFIEEHYTDTNITNDDLAAMSSVSTVYFRKLFTRIYGISPMKYVYSKRIEKAKNILETSYVTSITDVAASCGFNSVYYFSKAFKQEVSCSPSEYISFFKSKQHYSF